MNHFSAKNSSYCLHYYANGWLRLLIIMTFVAVIIILILSFCFRFAFFYLYFVRLTLALPWDKMFSFIKIRKYIQTSSDSICFLFRSCDFFALIFTLDIDIESSTISLRSSLINRWLLRCSSIMFCCLVSDVSVSKLYVFRYKLRHNKCEMFQ